MSVAEYFTQAKKQVEQQQWQEASESFQKIIELEPNRWDANFNLGQVLTKQQRYEEAIQAYKNAISINNNYAWSYNNLGIILLHLKRTKEATDCFSQAIQIEDKNPWFYRNLAQALVRQGNEAKALDCFKKAVQIKPDSPELQVELGESLKKQGSIKEAVNCFGRAIRINPNYLPAYTALKFTQLESPWLDKVIAFYQEILEKNQDLIPALISLAELLTQQEKLEKAIDYYRQAIIIAPKENPLYIQAIQSYKNALESLTNPQPELYYQWGKLLRSQGYFLEAIAAYQKAIKIDPQFELAYIDIQYTSIAEEQLEQLIDFYQRIVKDFSYPLAWGNLGDALTQQGKIQEAIACYQTSSYQQTIQKYPQLAKLNWPEKKEQAPDFLIIGASKCGTTSLYYYLSHHKQILFSHKKELNFFKKYFNLGIDWYLSHFPTITDRENFLTGEATPNYLRFPIVAERIKQYCPHIKLILLLRNPIDRAVSWHYHKQKLGLTNDNLEQAINQEMKLLETLSESDIVNFGFKQTDNIISGLYYYQIKAWMKYLPRQNFLILKSEDFYCAPETSMEQVFTFLGLSVHKISRYPKINSSFYGSIDRDLRETLSRYFQPYNKLLEDYLEIKFNW